MSDGVARGQSALDLPALDLPALDRLVAAITVDAYDVEEQVTAFFEAFANEVELPVQTVVLGLPVEVVEFGIADNDAELTARCRRGADAQELSLTYLMFPADSVVGWLHAGYRRCLGLRPYPASQPPNWELGD